VKLGDKEFTAVRAGLKDWIKLEDIKPLKTTSRDEFARQIYLYLSVALGMTKEELEALPWSEVAEAYVEVVSKNLPSIDFPLLKPRDKDKDEDIPWEYEGRTWYLWAHIIAKSYGWDLEYIAKMDIDDAIALIEETMVSEQLDKEWWWSINEGAYSYDDKTKKSTFNPLSRPMWMRKEVQPPLERKVMIPKRLIPMGIIRPMKGAKPHEPTPIG
jgi:hypothetical protein